MKRIFPLATLCFIISIFLLSCDGNEKIKSVEVDDTEYSTFYLYRFEEAEVGLKYSYLNDSVQKPTSSGYIYSSQNLSSGDTIKVWGNIIFYDEYETVDYYNTSSIGTNAIVKEKLDTYNITIEEKSDTYVITYYTHKNSTFSQKEDIIEVEKHKIEVVKERVTIEYE